MPDHDDDGGERATDKPKDLVAIQFGRDFTCADCGTGYFRGALLTLDDAGPCAWRARTWRTWNSWPAATRR